MRGRWLELFHQVVKPEVPGLYFLGFFNVSGGGNIRMMDDQAEWVAALETGEVGLPSPQAMQRTILKERDAVTRLYPDSPRYALELDPRSYRKALAGAMRRANAAVRQSEVAVAQATSAPQRDAPPVLTE